MDFSKREDRSSEGHDFASGAAVKIRLSPRKASAEADISLLEAAAFVQWVLLLVIPFAPASNPGEPPAKHSGRRLPATRITLGSCPFWSVRFGVRLLGQGSKPMAGHKGAGVLPIQSVVQQPFPLSIQSCGNDSVTMTGIRRLVRGGNQRVG